MFSRALLNQVFELAKNKSRSEAIAAIAQVFGSDAALMTWITKPGSRALEVIEATITNKGEEK